MRVLYKLSQTEYITKLVILKKTRVPARHQNLILFSANISRYWQISSIKLCKFVRYWVLTKFCFVQSFPKAISHGQLTLSPIVVILLTPSTWDRVL